MGLLGNWFRQEREEEIEEEVSKKGIVAILVPNKNYKNELLKRCRYASENFNKTVFLSLNKPSLRVIEFLKKNNINTEKFLFVDAISKSKENADVQNIVYISSLEDFKNFSEQLNQIVESNGFDCLIFDSLNTLLLYQDETVVTKFIHNLIAKLIAANVNGILICLSEISHSFVNDLFMFVDKVIDTSKSSKEAAHEEMHRSESIAKVKNELEAIRQAYASKLISEGSYLRGKQRAEEKLRIIKKIDLKHMEELGYIER